MNHGCKQRDVTWEMTKTDSNDCVANQGICDTAEDNAGYQDLSQLSYNFCWLKLKMEIHSCNTFNNPTKLNNLCENKFTKTFMFNGSEGFLNCKEIWYKSVKCSYYSFL